MEDGSPSIIVKTVTKKFVECNLQERLCHPASCVEKTQKLMEELRCIFYDVVHSHVGFGSC